MNTDNNSQRHHFESSRASNSTGNWLSVIVGSIVTIAIGAIGIVTPEVRAFFGLSNSSAAAPAIGMSPVGGASSLPPSAVGWREEKNADAAEKKHSREQSASSIASPVSLSAEPRTSSGSEGLIYTALLNKREQPPKKSISRPSKVGVPLSTQEENTTDRTSKIADEEAQESTLKTVAKDTWSPISQISDPQPPKTTEMPSNVIESIPGKY